MIRLQRLRRHKSEWAILSFYAVAALTVSFFVFVFGSFLLNGVVTLALNGLDHSLADALLTTFSAFAWAYLWAVPWALLLTVFCLRHRRFLITAIVRRILQLYLQTPAVIVGVITLAWFGDQPVGAALSLVIGLVALPQLVNGWLELFTQTPNQVREAALAIGMPFGKLFYHVYLVRHIGPMIEHLLRVTGVLMGAVAPFVYITNFSAFETGPHKFLALELFRELIKGNDGASFVWTAILALTILIVGLTSSSDRSQQRSQGV